MAAQSVLVLLLAGYLVLLGQILGRFHHAGDVAEPLLRRDGLPRPHQPVVEGLGAEAAAPAGLVDVVLGVAHALDATGNHRVGVFGLHQHGGVEDRLQARGTAAVKLVAGHLDGQVGLECGQTSNGGILAAGIAAAQDDVVQPGGVDAAALDGFLDNQGCQVGGGNIAQASAKSGHGSPHRRYYSDSSHVNLLV